VCCFEEEAGQEEAEEQGQVLPGNVHREFKVDAQDTIEGSPMPMILVEASVAAGAVNNNVVSGSAFEFARVRQLMSCGVVQSATGGFTTITSGPDIIAEEFSVPILGTYPIIPDNMYFTDVMEQGDRLVIRYRNPTAGALTVRVLVQTSSV
jgi:hypothetical protein